MASRTKTWKAILPAALTLIILALLTTGWHWAKGKGEAEFAKQATMRNSRTALTCGQQTWSGYPFKLQLECADPIIHLDQGQTQLRPQLITGYVLAPNLKTLIIQLRGPTQLQHISGETLAQIKHQQATIRIHVQSRNHITSETEIRNMEVHQPKIKTATADQVRLRTTHELGADDDVQLALNLTNLELHNLKADSVVIPEVQTTIKIADIPREPAANAVEWMQAAAGKATTFNVESLKARYGVTELTAQGTLKIESTGTVDGTLQTRVTGLNAFLQDLQTRQALTRKQATAAATLLGLFDKGQGVIADLKLKDQNMYWGPLYLGRQTPLF